MSAAAIDLSEYGYTEREFYASGLANRYRGAVTGSQQNATLIDGNWAYATRVLVRTPKPSKFNGTLLVEWTNVTIGVDADFVFGEAYDSLLRQGYAIAVVSVQKRGVDRLKPGARTGTDPFPSTHATWICKAEDPSIRVARPAALLIRCRGTSSPRSRQHEANVGATHRSRLDRRQRIATGQSQSAGRLRTYYNTIQPLLNFFDGFVLWDRAFAPLRSDLTVPAISVNSESFSYAYPRVPDIHVHPGMGGGRIHSRFDVRRRLLRHDVQSRRGPDRSERAADFVQPVGSADMRRAPGVQHLPRRLGRLGGRGLPQEVDRIWHSRSADHPLHA